MQKVRGGAGTGPSPRVQGARVSYAGQRNDSGTIPAGAGEHVLPRTLDDLLADARAFAYDADLAEEEEWASRRRLAYDYADAVRRGTAGGGGFPQPALGPASLGVTGGGRPGLSRRERAARALRALSSWAIRGPRAVEHIADLATTHQIDPDNALVFACLLHLADRDDQAEVLWQFSAGAGKPASAECLYLMHIVRGELQQARHWARQAAELDHTGEAPPPSQTAEVERGQLTSMMLLRSSRALRGEETGTSLTISAFHACAGTLSRAMTRAIQSLKTEPAVDFGPLSWPDHTLADQMQEALSLGPRNRRRPLTTPAAPVRGSPPTAIEQAPGCRLDALERRPSGHEARPHAHTRRSDFGPTSQHGVRPHSARLRGPFRSNSSGVVASGPSA